MTIVLVILFFQHALFEKVILTKYSLRTKSAYYTFNYALVFFGMIDKLIGFERAWDKKGPIAMNFIILTGSIILIYNVIKGILL